MPTRSALGGVSTFAAAATARHEPVDQVLATLKAAGIDLEPLCEQLEAQSAK